MLRLVGKVHTRLLVLSDEEVRAITWAREEGATWDEIGQAMGMTRQAAHRRYSLNVRGATNGGAINGGESTGCDRAADESQRR